MKNPSVLGALAVLLSSCKPPPPVVPPELAEETRYDVESSGKMFSASSAMSAGPYAIEGRTTIAEDETKDGDHVRTTRKAEVQLSMTTQGGKRLGAACTDTFAWTKVGDNVISEDVVDTFECKGEGWSMLVEAGEGSSYVGNMETKEGSLTIRSLHEQFAGMAGALAGYAFGDRGSAVCAVERAKNGKPGSIWLEEGPEDALVLGALALLYFGEGR